MLYEAARKAADKANNAIRREHGLVRVPVDVHKVNPLKFGGSPTDPANKIILLHDIHRQQVTLWWSKCKETWKSSDKILAEGRAI